MPLDDTSAAARAVIDRRYAEMSPAEKLDRMRAVTLAANEMALAGLRARHPNSSDGELLLRLARLRLGEDLVRRAYGDARIAE